METNKDSNPEPAPAHKQAVTFWQTVSSVLAAFFGVQSSAARKRDFSHGKPMAFILVALGLTALFVLALFTLVRVIVHQAAA